MLYFVFTIYLLIFSFLVIKLPFFQQTQLGTGWLLTLLFTRIFLGLLTAYIMLHYFNTSDPVELNTYASGEYNLLKSNPSEFFATLFPWKYTHGYGGFFDSTGSYWNDLKMTFLSKFLAPFQLFNRGNFYLNTLIFIFISFLGNVFLYRLLREKYLLKGKAAIAVCFFLPSTFLFSVNLHKDAIVFMAMAGFIYSLGKLMTDSYNRKALVTLFFTFVIMLLLRNYVCLVLLPLSIWAWVTQQLKIRPVISLGVMIAATLSGLFILSFTNFNPLELITTHQRDFGSLEEGKTHLGSLATEPSIFSFAKSIPIAIDHAFFRPHLFFAPLNILYFFAVEMILILAAGFVTLYYYFQSNNTRADPFLWMLCIFAGVMIIITGFIVPNLGAIIRYRSLYLPFLVIPILVTLHHKYYKK
ncbi:MAG: hypothetical protein ABIT96_06205 [Ferruginibacter sp.]